MDLDKNVEKPKAGEAGWLVSMAEDLAREQELGPSGDTFISSGEMSSRRSSQGPSQASQDRSSGSFATGDSNSTLQPMSGSQPVSQASSNKFSQSQDNKLSQSQDNKLSQSQDNKFTQSQDNKLSQSQDNSQQMSQPSSMDVLASQAVSSQLLALAAAESQVNVLSSISKY